MGRMLKNTVFKTGSYALGVPTGSSSIGPDAPIYGQTRYNTSNKKLEFYANVGGVDQWNAVAREGNIALSVDNFTGNTLQSDYGPMSFSYDAGEEAQVLVHVGTVYQIPGVNYTFYGNAVIHFTSNPSDLSPITLVHGYASTISTLN